MWYAAYLPVNKGFETMQPTGAPGLAKCIITFCHQREGCSEVRKVRKKEGFERIESCPLKISSCFCFKAIIMAITIFLDGGSGVNIAGESAPEPPSPFKGAVSLTVRGRYGNHLYHLSS